MKSTSLMTCSLTFSIMAHAASPQAASQTIPSRPSPQQIQPQTITDEVELKMVLNEILEDDNDPENFEDLIGQVVTDVFSDPQQIKGKLTALREAVTERIANNNFSKSDQKKVHILENALMTAADSWNWNEVESTFFHIVAGASVMALLSGLPLQPTVMTTKVVSRKTLQVSSAIARRIVALTRLFQTTTPRQRLLITLARQGISPSTLQVLDQRLLSAEVAKVAQLPSDVRFMKTMVSGLQIAGAQRSAQNPVVAGYFYFRQTLRRGLVSKDVYIYRTEYLPQQELEEIRSLLYRGRDRRRYAEIEAGDLQKDKWAIFRQYNWQRSGKTFTYSAAALTSLYAILSATSTSEDFYLEELTSPNAAQKATTPHSN